MSTKDLSRRDALRAMLGAAAGTQAVGAAGCAQAPTQTPDGTEAKGSIDTIVVCMMENRTFDHYFGALTLEEGRTDVDGLTADMVNLDLDGNEVHPFHLEIECLEDPPHGWDASHDQWNDGANDGFVKRHAGGRGPTSHEAMGYHNRADLPIFYALADEGALCQRWFASVMSSTWPNRIYALTATSEGMQGNDRGRIPFTHPSIFSQLTEAGVSWKSYFHDLPFATLIEASGGMWSENLRPIEEFFVDAETGNLPSVVFVEPSYVLNDDHPPHAPMLGQAFVGAVYAAMAQSPHWDTCMMVVDYDEHGGFFDHVAPPTAPDDHAAEGFDQLGFRVPAFVVGPYAKVGAVIDTQYDHSSVLKHIQEMWDLEPLTKRNANANALWDCLDLDRLVAGEPNAPVTLPVLEFSPDDYGVECKHILHPGQEELYDAMDAGQIDPIYDRRDIAGVVLDHVMSKAEKLGVVRFREGDGTR